MTEPAAVTAVLRLPIGKVHPGSNVRGVDVGDVTELAASIRAVGIQQPLLVVDDGHGGYAVLDGHRRLKAAALANLSTVPAILRTPGKGNARIVQQLALAGGKDLDPIAWADALHALMFGDPPMTREEVARAVGKPPGFVRDRIALRLLTRSEQDQVRAGRLPLGEALVRVQARRAERDGRPPPAPPPLARYTAPTLRDRKDPHCRTCTCPGRGHNQ